MRLLLSAFLLAAASAARAQNGLLQAPETAAFLDVGAGARAIGMGGAATALADDAHALYWNPAGLAGMKDAELAVSHAELNLGTHHDFAAYAHPTKHGTFAAGATYLSQGDIEGRDAAGRRTGNFSASDAALAAGAARDFGVVQAGAAVKYIRSHIATSEAQTVAFDAGVRRALGPWRLGAAVRNVGPGLRYDSETDALPLRLALGGAYRFVSGHALAVDLVNGPREGDFDAGIGGEVSPVKGVKLRAGYNSRGAVAGGSGFDAARGFTLGLGLQGARWGLDYAAAPMGQLGSVHRFSVSWRPGASTAP